MKHGDHIEVAAVAQALMDAVIKTIDDQDLCPHCTIMTVALNLLKYGASLNEVTEQDMDLLMRVVKETEALEQQETMH